MVSEIKKMQVFGSGMHLIGKVKDVVFDTKSFRVTDIVVGMKRGDVKRYLGKRLTLTGSQVLVPVDVIESIGDAVVLKLPADQLKDNVRTS